MLMEGMRIIVWIEDWEYAVDLFNKNSSWLPFLCECFGQARDLFLAISIAKKKDI